MPLYKSLNKNSCAAIAQALPTAVANINTEMANALVANIQRRMDSPHTGTVYPDGHQASAPGEAPAIASGALYASVAVVHPSLTGAEVVVSDPNAAVLEFGRADGTIAPRP